MNHHFFMEDGAPRAEVEDEDVLANFLESGLQGGISLIQEILKMVDRAGIVVLSEDSVNGFSVLVSEDGMEVINETTGEASSMIQLSEARELLAAWLEFVQ